VDEVLAGALKAIATSGPLALVLGGALVYQTRKRDEAEGKIEKLYGEMLALLKSIGGTK